MTLSHVVSLAFVFLGIPHSNMSVSVCVCVYLDHALSGDHRSSNPVVNDTRPNY